MAHQSQGRWGVTIALGYQSIAASQMQMCIHVTVKGNKLQTLILCEHLAAGPTVLPASIVADAALHEPGPILQGLGDKLGQSFPLRVITIPIGYLCFSSQVPRYFSTSHIGGGGGDRLGLIRSHWGNWKGLSVTTLLHFLDVGELAPEWQKHSKRKAGHCVAGRLLLGLVLICSGSFHLDSDFCVQSIDHSLCHINMNY